MDLRDRIERLERRMRRVERHLALEDLATDIPPARVEPVPAAPIAPRVEPPALPEPIPPTPVLVAASTIAPAPAPAPAALPRPAPRPHVVPSRAPAVDLERFLGVAVLGRIGVAALLLAAGYFAQLAYKSFGPELRVLSIYGLSAALVGVGFALRSKVAARYVAILWGGGVAAAYLAGVVAKLSYGLVGPFEATGLLLGACALGQVLAHLSGVQALAHVALAGAFAAPVLVGGPTDARTSLLVYLVTLHAWAAWTEIRRGWKGARILAVFGTVAVAGLWLLRHGETDVSTYLHVHGYLFALTMPEWGRAMLGRPVSAERSHAAFGPALVAEVLLVLVTCFTAAGTVGGPGTDLYRFFPLVAGASWLALALLARLRAKAPTLPVPDLARIAGTLLWVATLTAWPLHLASGPWTPGTASLASLAVLGVVAVLARSWFGSGGGIAVLTSVAGLLLLSGRSHPDPWALTQVLAPAALVLAGGTPLLAAMGVALGAIVPFAGIAKAAEPWWFVGTLGLSVAWTVVARARALRAGQALAAWTADVVLVGLLFFWARGAFASPVAEVAHAILNPVTVGGLAYAAALAWVLRSPVPPPSPGALSTSTLLPGVLGVLAFLLGWREVHAAAGGAASLDMALALETLYLAAFSAACIVMGRASGQLRLAGLGLLALATLRAFGDADAAGGGASALLELGSLAAAVAVAAVTGARERESERTGLAAIALGVAALWFAFLTAGRFATETALMNPRFAAGLVAVALLVGLRRLEPAATPGARPLLLGTGAALLGFFVGLWEVFDAVRPIGSAQWRAALVSAYGALYAAAMLAIGFRWKNAPLRWFALAGFGIVIVKVGLHDLSFLETPFRILVTACLGVVLLVAAYAYARKDRPLGDAAGLPVAPSDPGPEGG